jgi:hypothetical protein
MQRIAGFSAALVICAWQPAAAQTTGSNAPPRTEIGAVAIVPQWGQTDYLGGVELLYRVARRGVAGVEIGGAWLRAFPDKAGDVCILTPRPGDVCDIRAVDGVFVASAGLRVTGRASERWQFVARAGPSLYTARVVENSEPTGDRTSGVMLGGAVGVHRRVARSVVLFELRAATIPAALSGRGSLYGVRLGLGF